MEKPPVEFIQAEHFRPGSIARIRRVVIHVNDGGLVARATANYFAGPRDGRGVSAHYVVGREGEIFQCVRDADIAIHAHDANADSIGIEHTAHVRPRVPPTDACYRASAQLVRWLSQQYGIPLDAVHVIGHAAADPKTTHTDCPNGAGWDWPRYFQLLTGRTMPRLVS